RGAMKQRLTSWKEGIMYTGLPFTLTLALWSVGPPVAEATGSGKEKAIAIDFASETISSSSFMMEEFRSRIRQEVQLSLTPLGKDFEGNFGWEARVDALKVSISNGDAADVELGFPDPKNQKAKDFLDHLQRAKFYLTFNGHTAPRVNRYPKKLTDNLAGVSE